MAQLLAEVKAARSSQSGHSRPWHVWVTTEWSVMGYRGRWLRVVPWGVCAAAAVWLVVSGIVDGWDKADPKASVVGAVSGLVALVLTILARPGQNADVELGVVADELAKTVKRQWADEVEARRLNDPYPLPVAWRTADAALTESWARLTGLASSWPGGPPSDPARWPANEAGLAGHDAQIHEVFAHRVPTRRLVVLGEPGSGKTVLLIRLLQDLIQRREDGEPVPVLFSLASWDPTHDSLEAWLAEQLRRSHPGLRAPAPTITATPGTRPTDLAQALLATGSIVPLLDGFDELPPALHTVALDTLNRTMPARQPLVLSSRAAPYRTALTRPDATVRLNGAAGIHLLPLTPQAAADYLRRDAGGPHAPAANRWNQVITHLGTSTPAGQALSTPFGLFLARTVYNPRPQATPGPHPHPDELCDTAAYPTRTALDTHLLNAYIPAAYSPHNPNPSPWTKLQALHTLTFLAHHLENHRDGTPNLAWWELHHAVSARTKRIIYGVLGGIGMAFLAVSTGDPWGGFAFGFSLVLASTVLSLLLPAIRRTPGTRLNLALRALAYSLTLSLLWMAFSLLAKILLGIETPGWRDLAALYLFIGGAVIMPLTFFRRTRTGVPKARIRWSLGSTLIGLLWVPGLTILGALAVGIIYSASAKYTYPGAYFGFFLGTPIALLYVVARAMRSEPSDLTTEVGAAPLLARDRRICLMFAPMGGLASGPIITLTIFAGASRAEAAIVVGCGVVIGLTVGAFHTAWADFVASRTYLAIRRRVPWRLMPFLQDAHEHRGVLRQIGTVYQFRHIELQRHLAQQPWPPVT
ncbi:NACHT domain-containing protein [Streptomyces sp. NPDC015184]|uniref:NACHT domain-containing protein n=1 Tax=Streptomyces sp. NPDC015184 TaxID=3364946 RepID=UPI0036F6AD15